MIYKREVKSFAKRQRRLSPRQQAAMAHCWDEFGVDLPEGLIDCKHLFGRDAPCVLEIGFGNGDSLWQMAKANPDKNFLAIEVHTPGIASLFVHMLENNVSNIRVIENDAVVVLRDHLADNSLSRVQLFFPDPWPKKRHHKRRILQPAFVQLIQQKLSKQGLFHCATDWENYAEHMMNVLSQSPGLENTQGEHNFADNDALALRPNTKFEKRGVNLGHGVWDLLFEKI